MKILLLAPKTYTEVLREEFASWGYDVFVGDWIQIRTSVRTEDVDCFFLDINADMDFDEMEIEKLLDRFAEGTSTIIISSHSIDISSRKNLYVFYKPVLFPTLKNTLRQIADQNSLKRNIDTSVFTNDLDQFPVLRQRAAKHRERQSYLLEQSPIYKRRDDTSNIYAQIYWIACTVANTLSDHPLRITLAGEYDIGKTACGLENCVNLSNPYILVGNNEFQYNEFDDEYLFDAFAGVTYREIAHLSCRAIYYSAMSKKNVLAQYIRLWADEYAEKILGMLEKTDRSRFLQSGICLEAARKVFIDPIVARTLQMDWEKLDEIEKFQALLFAFVRSPASIVEAYRGWCDVSGTNPLEKFENCFPKSPSIPCEILFDAKKTARLVASIRAKYPANAVALQKWLLKNGSNGNYSPECIVSGNFGSSLVE